VETLTDDQEPGVNQGQGAFRFTPQADRTYELRIDTPTGISARHTLPKVKETGVVLTVPESVTTAHEPLRITIHNTGRDRNLLVGAYCRGRLFDHKSQPAHKDETVQVTLEPAHGVGGVYRITVFEERQNGTQRRQLVPLAERLVYRSAGERLNLSAKSEKPLYVPGEKAKLNPSARGENQQVTPAILLVSVVDRSLLTMADEKTARSMPTHFWLTSEVRKPEDLEYADFLLSPHPKAPVALDLLLGTQGWRRFAEQEPTKFRAKLGEEA